MFRFLFVIFLYVFQLFFSIPASVADTTDDITSSLQDRYKKAKFYYNQLETDPKLGNQRKLWLKSSRNFRQVYLSNPKSELAPASLYMLGKIYLRMHEKFQQNIDIEESISYFHDCTSLFPHHRLADDALFKLAEIQQQKYSNFEEAAKYYRDVIARYPMGDMHPQATTRLKLLSSQHDIELPDFMLGDPNHNTLANVLPVKYWSSADYSRVIIKASGPVTYSAQLLEKNKNMPRRLYIDFQKCYIEPRYRSPVPITDGLLKQIRTGQYTQDTVRVVLDIETVSSYKIFSLPDPFRVVVDVRGIDKVTTPTASKPSQRLKKPHLASGQIIVLKEQNKRKAKKSSSKTADKIIAETSPEETLSQTSKNVPDKSSSSTARNVKEPTLDATPELSLAQQLGLGVRKIVIDPGHGGKDPGAIAHGLKEKDIVLNLSKKLKENLEKNLGYEVVLTRVDDSYISLEERTAVANGNNADLFISLHVNAHPIASVHGLETYFLNLTNDREAMRVAAFENATSELQMSDLEDVLAGIMKNSKIKESSRLAHNVHNTVISGLKEDKQTLKDLGVKQAPFYVLIGAEMPAILVEIAFISNPKEAKRLGENVFLESFADQIVKGVRFYVDSNTASLALPQ